MDNEAPTSPETDEQPEVEATTPGQDSDEPQDDSGPEMFDRAYVSKLRQESAGYRDKAKTAETRADELGRQLFLARVAATGKLADPADLEYNPDLLDDTDKIGAAIENLLASKPHFASRKPVGNADIGQGIRGDTVPEVRLMDLLRQRA